MKATNSIGELQNLTNCIIVVPNPPNRSITITLYILPEISDSKSASYTDEAIIGRSFPFKTFSHGENRTVSMTVHFMTNVQSDINSNLQSLRALESLVYPGSGTSLTPYTPPPIAQIQCGKLLADTPLCAVLKSYSVKFPTDVVWDDNTYLPYKFDVDLSWEIVYDSTSLPGQSMILQTGG